MNIVENDADLGWVSIRETSYRQPIRLSRSSVYSIIVKMVNKSEKDVNVLFSFYVYISTFHDITKRYEMLRYLFKRRSSYFFTFSSKSSGASFISRASTPNSSRGVMPAFIRLAHNS